MDTKLGSNAGRFLPPNTAQPRFCGENLAIERFFFRLTTEVSAQLIAGQEIQVMASEEMGLPYGQAMPVACTVVFEISPVSDACEPASGKGFWPLLSRP